MTAQKKLWMFFFLLFLLFSAGVFLSLRMEYKHLLKIQSAEIKARKSGFEKILQLNAQSIFLLAKDYSYWDELVDAIKNEDTQWGKINIDSGIKTYQADAAWVYNVDLKWIYSVNRFGDDRIKTLPLDREQIKQIFGQQSLAHFFVQTPAGYMQVQGATVHPSYDSERKTPAQGYIFVGKLWDREYLGMLSDLAGSAVSVVPQKSVEQRKAVQENFSIEVVDWEKKPLFQIVGQVNSGEIKSFQNYSLALLRFFIFYTIIQMMVLLYFLRRFFRTVPAES